MGETGNAAKRHWTSYALLALSILGWLLVGFGALAEALVQLHPELSPGPLDNLIAFARSLQDYL